MGLVRDIAFSDEHVGVDRKQTEQRTPSLAFLERLSDNRRNAIIEAVAKEVCQKGMPGFKIRTLQPDEQAAIHRYVMPSGEIADLLELFDGHLSYLRQPALLLRGLFSMGLLKYALKYHRCHVTFGLHRLRTLATKLAVPYTAKHTCQ
jgi:hypothetical protein